jgi:hypothetical protein
MSKSVVRASRHGKPCVPSTRKDNPTLDAKALRRGVTARELVAAGRATTVRQARKVLQRGDGRKAAAAA